MPANSRINSFIWVVWSLGLGLCLIITSRTLNVAAAGDKQTAIAESASLLTRAPSVGATNSTDVSRLSQGAQTEKTVEQTRKNIQVLKGLPEAQLFLVMNFVASSLGVQCNFCHVQQGKDPKTGTTNWVWESDDKPEKHTARRMMQMVLSIKSNNKIDFRENEVTCYTCHRGQTHPVGLPPMPLARSGHESGPNDAAPDVRATLPSVEQVFGKYIEAVGGNAATGTRTLVMKGKREASQD